MIQELMQGACGVCKDKALDYEDERLENDDVNKEILSENRDGTDSSRDENCGDVRRRRRMEML